MKYTTLGKYVIEGENPLKIRLDNYEKYIHIRNYNINKYTNEKIYKLGNC